MPPPVPPVRSKTATRQSTAHIQFAQDGVYGSGTSSTPAALKHNLKTGNQIPVEIPAEVDRKHDDGRPDGAFQFSAYAPSGATAPTLANCVERHLEGQQCETNTAARACSGDDSSTSSPWRSRGPQTAGLCFNPIRLSPE